MITKDKLKSKLRKVKQLIVEKTGQVKENEKTSVLSGSYSILNVDYDLVRKALKSTVGNLENYILCDNHDDYKLVNYDDHLASCILADLDSFENTLLVNVLKLTGTTLKLESDFIISKLNAIKEDILPSIREILNNVFESLNQNKKEMNDARLKMDECKTRLISVKKSAASSTQQTNALSEKIKAVENEFSLSSAQFFAKEENMAQELLIYISNNYRYSEHYLKLMETEKQYHSDCLEMITHQIDTINDIFGSFTLEPVFGMSLHDIRLKYDQEISVVIESCLKFLYNNDCFQLQGIFRVAASGQIVKKIKSDFNSGIFDLQNYRDELYAVTGALKLYLSELPEPLFTNDKADRLVQISLLCSNERLLEIKKFLKEIPDLYAKNVLYLVSFLYVLSKHEDVTKMSASNLAIVIGPNLLRTEDESKVIKYIQAANNIMTDLIVNFPTLYPDWYENNEFKVENPN